MRYLPHTLPYIGRHCREAEAAAAAAEAERQRAEDDARRQAEEERAAREAEKRELRRLERKFSVRLLGRVEVARPDKVGAARLHSAPSYTLCRKRPTCF